MSKTKTIVNLKALKACSAAVALMMLLLSGCQDGEVLIDDDDIMPVASAIDFDNGFVDCGVVTRASSVLSDYSSTMGVWGWRSDNTTTDEALFLNHLVSYDAPAQAWTYSPLKYWEMHSTYRFYAYAPHSTAANATVAIDSATGRLTINDVTLVGSNIRSQATAAPSSSLINTFAGLADTDWMIDRKGRTAKGSTHMTVQFVMQHILSKLNVRVRTTAALLADPGLSSLVVDSITIDNLAAKGSFVQQLDHTPVIDNAADMSVPEWTLDATAAPIALVSAKTVAPVAEWTYTLESLALPQAVLDTQSVTLRYTMTFTDGRVEHYIFNTTLADAFGPYTEAQGEFVSGNSYTLSFTIGPDVIRFDGGVNDWDATIDTSYSIE